MDGQGQDVYCTLLLSDDYLPGALVLAHSLRDAHTSKKLAVMVTRDSISDSTCQELGKLYDFIVPVERILNRSPSNLYLMGRPDLSSAFTKINLWKQIHFRKIVYIDADVVSLRAPDELFDVPSSFAAAPDIGWPDCFNSGVMVLTPNLGDYYALLALAQRGISFDGADQGLLNMHFTDYSRISFRYNCTPSAHYQYVPAYRHFQAGISMVHFIGKEKPWQQGRSIPNGSGPYEELVGRWWAVYDRHYRVWETPNISGPEDTRDRAQLLAKPSSQNTPQLPSSLPLQPKTQREVYVVQQYVRGETPKVDYDYIPSAPPDEIFKPGPQTQPIENFSHTESAKQYQTQSSGSLQQFQPDNLHSKPKITQVQQLQPNFSAPKTDWDPLRTAPPINSRPEASNFPQIVYEMSRDPSLFQPPIKYPAAPADMWYQIPEIGTQSEPLKPIFPWEINASKPTRVFHEDPASEQESALSPLLTADAILESKLEALDTQVIPYLPPEEFATYSRSNVWDNMPEIEKYISGLQKARKGKIQVLQNNLPENTTPFLPPKSSMRLTDFPTEIERPSLPVTPAPIRRPSFWGRERDEEGKLPGAFGVPEQQDWDPVAKLEELTRRQSLVLESDISVDSIDRDIPDRIQPGSAIIQTSKPFSEGPIIQSDDLEESIKDSPSLAAPTQPSVAQASLTQLGSDKGTGLARKLLDEPVCNCALHHPNLASSN
ncbi:MAG: glycogenin glucosyltransferase [Trizodia sp. TS-e1964]|nr:MAG: glycogenin glucosyltransferase [Trizodia sp. TS-e1964]